MSDKQESNGKIIKGILRNRDTPSLVSNESINQRISAYRKKSKLGLKPSTVRSEDNAGSLFSRRSKLDRGDKPATAPVTPRTQIPIPISKRQSTITLDSRLTATSQSSLSHKPGFIPICIRNKNGTKHLVTTQMQTNKKKFIQIKKELSALQDKAVDCYKCYRDSLVKLNKLNGNDDPPSIEELKIVDFKEKAFEATNLIVPNTEIKLNEKLVSDISKQVRSIQAHSFDLLELFSGRLALINNQMKSAVKSGGGDTNLFPEEIQNLFNEIETKVLEEKQQQTIHINNFIGDLKQAMLNEEFKIELNVTPTETQPNKEVDSLVTKLNQIETSNKQLSKQLDDKTLELAAKDKLNDELKISVKSMQEAILRNQDDFKKQTDRLKTKCDDENKTLTKEIDRLKLTLNEIQRETPTNVEKHDKELDQLNTIIIELKADLNKSENQVGQKNQKVSELETLMKQSEKHNKKLREKLSKLEKMNNEKSKEIEQLVFDINKAETEIQLQQESLMMQKRLLTIRGELIQSMQANEDTSKNKISELNSEIQKRTSALNKLNKEVSTKTEELENLFSTLGAKDLAVKRQDHIIKLLEETHEKICVTQEGQIAHLEKENEKLKWFLAELNIPVQTSGTTSIEEINLRPYKHFYENFRRQKRNVNTLIKVKKYRN